MYVDKESFKHDELVALLKTPGTEVDVTDEVCVVWVCGCVRACVCEHVCEHVCACVGACMRVCRRVASCVHCFLAVGYDLTDACCLQRQSGSM